jgi:hypothetical protein
MSLRRASRAAFEPQQAQLAWQARLALGIKPGLRLNCIETWSLRKPVFFAAASAKIHK